ncbi:MAG: alkaline phosphatase family protein [Sphingobacteriales bacterium]|nr:alkaline phosphatase family protein [Sphingobacteriales bacterium]
MSNNWYDRKLGASIYCADDSTVQTVGSSTAAVGKMSPNNLLSTTIGDELRIATNFRARVVGVALKDRSCILPAGRGGNAAYWFDGTTGNFVSSTYYMTELPKWMQLFNEQKLPQKYLSKPWETIQPLSIYQKYCAPDDNRYEGLFSGEKRSVFPHNLPAITDELKTFDVLRVTPWGNTITKDIALAALENEKLGKGDVTIILTISFSSPDYIGHQFGPQSVEVMDNYLRLDKDIADLLSYLDKNYGKNNVLLFLTADHGAAQNIVYMQDHKLASGSIDVDDILLKLAVLLLKTTPTVIWLKPRQSTS